MCDLKYLLLVAVTAAVLDHISGRSFGLSDMINKTVCAISVYDDVREHRIPYRIKMITCADNTDQGCTANSIEQNQCCHRDNRMECVEMTDTVPVFNNLTKTTESFTVSVGCACRVFNVKEALDGEDMPGR